MSYKHTFQTTHRWRQPAPPPELRANCWTTPDLSRLWDSNVAIITIVVALAVAIIGL